MRSTLLTTLLILALGTWALAPVARAHGGAFRGPAPSALGPALPLAPPSSGGSTSGGASPSTGGGPASSATPSGPATGAASGGVGIDLDPNSWSVWWEFNRDTWLGLKARLYRASESTGGDEFFLGLGEEEVTVGLRPTDRQVRELVTPTLEEALAKTNSDDVVTACLVGLARIGGSGALPPGDRERIGRTITARVGGSLEVSETALLSLGILGEMSGVLLLRDVLADSPQGRKAIGKARVEDRRRAFAAYGLGLVGSRTDNADVRRFCVRALVSAMDTTIASVDATADVGVAVVTALGMVPLGGDAWTPGEAQSPTDSRPAQIEYLLGVLDARRLDRNVRGHVPRALARLVTAPGAAVPSALEGIVVRELVTRSKTRSSDPREVVAGCVQALGELASCQPEGVDAEIRAHLIALSGSGDTWPERFSRIALGEIGGRRGTGDPTAAREEILRALLGGLARGGNAGKRWSALGLAILGARMNEGGEIAPREIGDALRSSLERARSPEDIGAMATACGILRDIESAPALLEKLDRSSGDDPRGHVAIALGLLGEVRAIDPLREVVDSARYRPELLRRAAVGLGLVGDSGAVPMLADMLGEARSLASQASLASALGLIGDRRAVEALVRMVQDDGLTERARAFAIAGLGIVGDGELLPWSVGISRGVNYAAPTRSLHDDFVGKGVLNLL